MSEILAPPTETSLAKDDRTCSAFPPIPATNTLELGFDVAFVRRVSVHAARRSLGSKLLKSISNPQEEWRFWLALKLPSQTAAVLCLFSEGAWGHIRRLPRRNHPKVAKRG
jgi:hypothetical protein